MWLRRLKIFENSKKIKTRAKNSFFLQFFSVFPVFFYNFLYFPFFHNSLCPSLNPIFPLFPIPKICQIATHQVAPKCKTKKRSPNSWRFEKLFSLLLPETSFAATQIDCRIFWCFRWKKFLFFYFAKKKKNNKKTQKIQFFCVF